MAKASVARSTAPADKPVTPSLKQRLTVELDAAHLAMEEADSFVNVCNIALRHQSADADADVACVLDTVYDKIKAAREALVNIVDMLPEVSDGMRRAS